MKNNTLTAIAAILAIAFSFTASANDRNTISSTGNARIHQKPDIAFITVYVRGTGLLMVDANEEASKKSEAIIKTLRETYPQIHDIQIRIMRVGEVQTRQWDINEQNNLPRPEVFLRLRISIPPDSSLAISVIDKAIRSGAIIYESSSYDYPRKPSGVLIYGLMSSLEAENEAAINAITDAKKTASQLAEKVGKRAGDIIAVGCENSGNSWFQSGFSDIQDDFPTKYLSEDPHNLVVSTTVTLTFELLLK